MGNTNHHSLKTLSKVLLNRLENKKFIEVHPSQRITLQDALYSKLAKMILTEEDLNTKARDAVSKANEALSDANLTETEAYQSQKRSLKDRYSDNAIQGFYLQKTLRDVCKDVGLFLFDVPQVEDVFESDENIHRLVMETIQTFDESKIS